MLQESHCRVLTDIRSQDAGELKAQFEQWGLPAYRVDQLLTWLYPHRVTSWEQMSNLPKALRARLAEHYALNNLFLVRKQGSRDTTRKYLWRLVDGAMIESVLIPANPGLYGEASDRHTLCVSTQVGCAYGCRFCASGLDGWKRNLGVEEIVGQVLAVEREEETVDEADAAAGSAGIVESAPVAVALAERVVSNLVIMGMGEPLANYQNLLKALKILNASWGGGIGARKITISTSGLVPQIRQLADEPHQFRLAISLHGATDEVRNRIMPVNRKYPLKDLEEACAYYRQKQDRMMTFEYTLIEGVNDALDQVPALARLARRLRAKVNLIPYNRVEGLPWTRPSDSAQEAFLAALEKQGVSCTLRREKGHDIDAACGQLRLRTERESRDAGEGQD